MTIALELLKKIKNNSRSYTLKRVIAEAINEKADEVLIEEKNCHLEFEDLVLHYNSTGRDLTEYVRKGAYKPFFHDNYLTELLNEYANDNGEKLIEAAAAKGDYYEVFGIDPAVSDLEVKNVIKKLSLEFHPDKVGGDGEAFKEIGKASEVLGDPSQRKKYDLCLIEVGDVGEIDDGKGGKKIDRIYRRLNQRIFLRIADERLTNDYLNTFIIFIEEQLEKNGFTSAMTEQKWFKKEKDRGNFQTISDRNWQAKCRDRKTQGDTVRTFIGRETIGGKLRSGHGAKIIYDLEILPEKIRKQIAEEMEIEKDLMEITKLLNQEPALTVTELHRDFQDYSRQIRRLLVQRKSIELGGKDSSEAWKNRNLFETYDKELATYQEDLNREIEFKRKEKEFLLTLGEELLEKGDKLLNREENLEPEEKETFLKEIESLKKHYQSGNVFDLESKKSEEFSIKPSFYDIYIKAVIAEAKRKPNKKSRRLDHDFEPAQWAELSQSVYSQLATRLDELAEYFRTGVPVKTPETVPAESNETPAPSEKITPTELNQIADSLDDLLFLAFKSPTSPNKIPPAIKKWQNNLSLDRTDYRAWLSSVTTQEEAEKIRVKVINSITGVLVSQGGSDEVKVENCKKVVVGLIGQLMVEITAVTGQDWKSLPSETKKILTSGNGKIGFSNPALITSLMERKKEIIGLLGKGTEPKVIPEVSPETVASGAGGFNETNTPPPFNY